MFQATSFSINETVCVQITALINQNLYTAANLHVSQNDAIVADPCWNRLPFGKILQYISNYTVRKHQRNI